ncbi:hypothetical protein DC421_12335 [Priestia megaterium]|nr:hypothetical protein DC428_19355 [Priestia megaterium]PVE84233.1 hypothetical protein DC421_12335 [Priestia megaterium]PVE91336.1 hypothetical protein DC426_10295 [Priestia megaterium]PVE97778.1 hypothetical protein DC433_17755 [Priestia megaterium]
MPSNPQLEATTYMKPTFTFIITIKRSERFIVRIFLQLTYFWSRIFKVSKYRLFRVKLALLSDRDQVRSRCLVYQERK